MYLSTPAPTPPSHTPLTRSSTVPNPVACSTSSTTWRRSRPSRVLTGRPCSIPASGRRLGRTDRGFGRRKSGSCPRFRVTTL
ncbi:unnamed protein product [Linum tenue]|uniref:Uncharacterized protein n=1 Tax=Linum tenue TaxID=586396 RepID=A0AAV0PR37_9ROSI|nr:unnamed protein product [Linum tenue]